MLKNVAAVNGMETMYDYRFERESAILSETCEECGYGIAFGDDFYHVNDKVICNDCIDHFKHVAGEE